MAKKKKPVGKSIPRKGSSKPAPQAAGRRKTASTEPEGDGLPDWFWSIIKAAHQDAKKLGSLLHPLSKDKVVEFRAIFDAACAAVLTDAQQAFLAEREGDDLSEDTLDDLADCVVSQGRDYFLKVVGDPALFPTLDDSDSMVQLRAATTPIFFERFGENLHDYLN